jgi:hypothetical protein
VVFLFSRLQPPQRLKRKTRSRLFWFLLLWGAPFQGGGRAGPAHPRQPGAWTRAAGRRHNVVMSSGAREAGWRGACPAYPNNWPLPQLCKRRDRRPLPITAPLSEAPSAATSRRPRPHPGPPSTATISRWAGVVTKDGRRALCGAPPLFCNAACSRRPDPKSCIEPAGNSFDPTKRSAAKEKTAECGRFQRAGRHLCTMAWNCGP